MCFTSAQVTAAEPRAHHRARHTHLHRAQRRLCASPSKLDKVPLRESEQPVAGAASGSPHDEAAEDAAQPASVVVNKAIERIGLGRFHYVAAAICGLANASDAVELLCISFILPELTAEGVTPSDEGILAASVFVGMLVGGLVMGFASDHSGRRRMLTLSLFINALFGLLSAAAPNWGTLAVCRVLAGVGVGGSIPAVFTLFTEYLPSHKRGFMINLIAWQWMVGTLYAAGMAWILIGAAGLSWRVYAVVCAIPAATACALTWFLLPESPRFLARRVPRALPRGVLPGSGLPAIYEAVSLSSVSAEGEGDASPHAGLAAASGSSGSSGAAAFGAPASASERSSLLGGSSAVPAAGSAIGTATGVSVAAAQRAPNTVRARWAVPSPQTYSVACAGVLRHMATRNRVSDDADLTTLLDTIATREPALEAGGGVRATRTPSRPLRSRCQTSWLAVKSCPRRSKTAWMHPRTGGVNLFRPPFRRTTVLLLIVWAALSLGWYSLNVWLPQLLSDAQVALSPHNASFLAAAAALPGNILTGLLIDKLGRKKLMVISLGLAAGFAACFAAAQEQWQMLLASCMLNCVSVGSWNTLDSLSVESFPTRLRTSAMGLLAAAGRTGSIVGQIAFGQMIHGNRVGLLVTACLALLSGALAGWMLPKEHTGKALEEGGEDAEVDDQDEAAEEHEVAGETLTVTAPLRSI